jgi:hypothetical protein
VFQSGFQAISMENSTKLRMFSPYIRPRLNRMSGERASTTRSRLAGKICAKCGNRLSDAPLTPGERLCSNCRSPQIHRVYMYYMFREVWTCQFLEEDMKTPLQRQLHFRDVEKIREIVAKVGNFANLQDRQALDYGLRIGRGGVWLQLTQDQYQRLRA